jgi:hypothetical protein
MSPAANTAARAMSSAWASRPSAILAIVSSGSRLACSAPAPLNRAGAARYPGVPVAAGATAATRIPAGASSRAGLFTRPAVPCLAASSW